MNQQRHQQWANAPDKSPSTAKPTKQRSEQQSAPPDLIRHAIETGSAETLTPAVIHTLQRTRGNRFVQRLVQRLTNANTQDGREIPGSQIVNRFLQPANAPVVQRLTVENTKWKSADEAHMAGTEGVNVVFFMGSDGEEIVIKLESAGAALSFASQIYSGLVETPKTRIVQKASEEGQQIISTLARLLKKKKVTNITNETLNRIQTQGSVFVLMEKKALTTLERFARELDPGEKRGTGEAEFNRLILRIFNTNFFQELGRIHAADIFLGNADRLDPGKTQVQNIFVGLEKGGALGLDFDVQAASLQAVKESAEVKRKQKGGQTVLLEQAIPGNEYKDWVQYALEGSGVEREVRDLKQGKVVKKAFGGVGSSMGVANVAHLTDAAALDKIIDDLKARLVKNFGVVADKAEGQRRMEMITGGSNPGLQASMNKKWQTAKQEFKSGVEEGLKTISQGMESGAYEKMFGEATQAFGQHETFDFIVFQIRHKYLEKKKENPKVNEAKLRLQLEQYAEFMDTGKGTNPFGIL